MEKEAAIPKTKNASKPQPDGLKPTAIKWKKKSWKSKNKKNPSKAQPDGLKPTAMKWKKKPQIKKQKKSIIAWTRRT